MRIKELENFIDVCLPDIQIVFGNDIIWSGSKYMIPEKLGEALVDCIDIYGDYVEVNLEALQ